MVPSRLASAVASVPTGRWGVAVSGGADSVALLVLLRSRPDLKLHVIHLDHQARESSADDAKFVADLAARFELSCSLATRQQLEPQTSGLPKNLSARFRALRLMLFEQVARAHHLQGVIVAHHADDQAETVLQRLLRGSGYEGLCGMNRVSRFGTLKLLRPLLDVSRAELRQMLQSIGQTRREDPSNASEKYLRNRLRRFLTGDPAMADDLLALSAACRALRRWVQNSAERLDATFPAQRLANLPIILARQSGRRWLIDRGIPPAQITPQSLDQLFLMASDAATPARAAFPAGLLVRRRQGMIFAESTSRQ